MDVQLVYREEAVDIRAHVRWAKPLAPVDDDKAPLASWEVGIAFDSIGAVGDDSFWRGLRPYVEPDP